MKVCYRCKQTKKNSAFCKNCERKDGLTTYCKDCLHILNKKWRDPEKHRQASIQWYYRKRHFIDGLKINGCAICGYNKCVESLDFHHVNPRDKKFRIAAGNYTKEKILEEVNKCILLCKNCHFEIHYKEKIKIRSEKVCVQHL